MKQKELLLSVKDSLGDKLSGNRSVRGETEDN